MLPASDLRTINLLIGTLALAASFNCFSFYAAAGNSRDTSYFGSQPLGSIVVAACYWFSFRWEGSHRFSHSPIASKRESSSPSYPTVLGTLELPSRKIVARCTVVLYSEQQQLKNPLVLWKVIKCNRKLTLWGIVNIFTFVVNSTFYILYYIKCEIKYQRLKISYEKKINLSINLLIKK